MISTMICSAFALTPEFDHGDEESKQFLAIDMSIEVDSSQYRRIVTYALVMIVAVPVGIPALLFVLLWRNRKVGGGVTGAATRNGAWGVGAFDVGCAAQKKRGVC